MKIAQIAPMYESVPPEKYGGTERVVAALADSLVEMGHEVTLFAPGGSNTLARLVETVHEPLRQRFTQREMLEVAPHLHLRMLADVYRRAEEFDVIHSHVDVWTLPCTTFSPTPTVLTLHGRLDLEHVVSTLPLYPDVALVSISDDQRRPLAGSSVRWAATIHNGLDLSSYSATSIDRGDHLLFVGRISPEKGPAAAVEVARRSGRSLTVAAKVDPVDVAYHRTCVEPLFAQDDVRFVGEVGESEKPGLYGSAAATLFPSDWPEPFGLVMIESMAAGTPVIALRRGSVPEVVIDGVTGFVCDTLDDMVDAVARVDQIDPEDCRRSAADFRADSMAEAYVQVYEDVVARATRRGHIGSFARLG